MMTKDYFDENGWLKQEFLWKLRQEIVLGSIYVADYRNSFGINEHKVCDFFTSFWDSFCEELAKEDGLREEAERLAEKRIKENPNLRTPYLKEDIYYDLSVKKYDNEETLLNWYGCFDDNPLPPTYINVDIHWDFSRSIQVIAASEYEAVEIVEQMMSNGEIPRNSFEPTDDYEFDTTWQPKN